jgi:hypothetical protein
VRERQKERVRIYRHTERRDIQTDKGREETDRQIKRGSRKKRERQINKGIEK